MTSDSAAKAGTPSRAKQRVFSIIMLLLMVALVEGVARRVMPERLELARRILVGRTNPQRSPEQRTLGQPYLLYINTPGYVSPRFGPQHNEDGYRGKAVTLDRQPGVYRILCLGGSTTYGYTVGHWEQAYPAQLELLLKTNPPPGYTDVEVINGGLPWATSAEMLTHYHFKYHYYRPDLVILNEGINDSDAYVRPFYHPDNSHYRQPLMNLRPLPPGWRWLAHSRLLSLFMLNIFYADQLHGGEVVVREGRRPDAAWFKPGGQLMAEGQEVPDEHLAFLHNMETLIRMVQADQARVLLVPVRLAPDGYAQKPFQKSQILRHEHLLGQLAVRLGTGYAPFPGEVISAGNWEDYCHLKPKGETEKAVHLAGYVRALVPGWTVDAGPAGRP